MGIKEVDLAIQNGVDLDGTSIPANMLNLCNRVTDKNKKGVA
tara:strand:+ start:244 stop:369 length:126 start_codon:yes stop_codon:yes gene_type:complete